MPVMAATHAVRTFLREIAQSSAQVLFAHSAWVGLLLFGATATQPPVFALGALAVVIASLLAKAFGVDAALRGSGYYGYNAFLVGAGIGYLYGESWSCVPVAVLASAVAFVLTAAGRALLTRIAALPVLSLPFVATLWLVVVAGPLLGLEPSIHLVQHGQTGWDGAALHFLRCLGSIFFVPTVQGGSAVLLALLIHSRLATLGALSAFAALAALDAMVPSLLSPALFDGLAANIMLLVIAVGGVWFVPSGWSLLWAVGAALGCVLLGIAIDRPLHAAGIPVLFVPFNFVSLAVLLAARERGRDEKPKSVDFLAGSPEQNLDYVLNQHLRFPSLYGVDFQLPFRGRWTCTQSSDGEHTHQGPWRFAFDFQVVGDDGELYAGSPAELTNYHGFRLPVLAAADGVVVRVENDVPDNPVGTMDLVRNWGNVVVLQHAHGLYSLVSHLAHRSSRVKEGQRVARGDILGLCGNSGRSPTPHIHFHLQVTSQPGSPTLPVSFANIVRCCAVGETLEISHAPGKGDVCRNLELSAGVTHRLLPRVGDRWRLRDRKVEEIAIDLDVLGRTRLTSERASMALVQIPHGVRLIEVNRNRKSALSLMRAAIPSVPFEENASLLWKDYVSRRALPGRSWGERLCSLIVPPRPLLVHYVLREEDRRLLIEGNSFRRDVGGCPLLRTQIVFDDQAAPVSIEVRHRNRSRRAVRVVDEVASGIGRSLTRSTEGELQSGARPFHQRRVPEKHSPNSDQGMS